MDKPDLPFLEKYARILIMQLIVVFAVIMVVTAVRFLSADLFGELKAVYNRYACSETDISLVSDGEK